MKSKLKLGILFVIITLFLNCSNENKEAETVINQMYRITSLDDVKHAKELFIEMTKSYEYIDYKESLNAFVSKMNDNAILFKTKEEYIEWITLNLSKTSFNSVEQFKNMIEDMLLKHETLAEKNTVLFSFLKVANSSQFLEIVKPSLTVVPYITNATPCQNGCMNDCEDQLNGDNFAYSMGYGDLGNPTFAEAYHVIRVKQIIKDLNTCMSGC